MKIEIRDSCSFRSSLLLPRRKPTTEATGKVALSAVRERSEQDAREDAVETSVSTEALSDRPRGSPDPGRARSSRRASIHISADEAAAVTGMLGHYHTVNGQVIDISTWDTVLIPRRSKSIPLMANQWFFLAILRISQFDRPKNLCYPRRLGRIFIDATA
jgi:hypothetical protein